MTYDLPTSVEVGGRAYAIRSDYRAILDIMVALSDAELTDEERAYTALDIFYPDLAEMPDEDYQAAIDKCFWFISGGDPEEKENKSPRLVDWELDFPRIVAPINKAMGKEIRGLEYLHWWTFLAAYMEIGDCLFAQIVNIRAKRAKGKKLDKQEQEFYRKNRQIIDIKTNYTQAEQDLLDAWTGGKSTK